MNAPLRRLALLLVVLLTAALAACGSEPTVGFGRDIDALLAAGRAHTDSLLRADTSALDDATTIELGYIERARIGLGSPFRLIAYIRRDRRLAPEARERLAYGVLAMLLEGRSYEVDPAVLDLLRVRNAAAADGVGLRHLQLIERTIAAAPTSSSGERAVRIGYGIAEAERITAPVPQALVTQVAALVADRRRSRLDAGDLLRSAAAAQADPLELLEAWRRERRLRVERPAQTPMNLRWEAYEARSGADVAKELRTLSFRLSAPVAGRGGRAVPSPTPPGVLSPQAAHRLAALARAHDYPAQAPLAVAVMMNRAALHALAGPEPHHGAAVATFVDEATSEERFVAALAALRADGASHGVQLSLLAVQAATVFRVWNQEEPWFPGDAAPSVRDVVARFGLEAIDFAADVPQSWRPYYVRQLAYALNDLRSVAPTVSLRELTFRIAALPPERRALALHQPRERRIILPPVSGAGTIAHEVAHELDRQLARRRYGQRAAYATDLGTGERRGDRVASSVNSLNAAFGPAPGDTLATAHATRAAEVFARGFDWFVAILLARDGRVGGYLTSYQDPAITGYGTTRGQEVGHTAVPALVELLDQVAPVTVEARGWAFERFGPNRPVSSEEIASSLRQAGAVGTPLERIESVARVQQQALRSLDATACRLTGIEDVRRLVEEQRLLIHTAADAAVRGVVVDAVRAHARALEEPVRQRTADAWLAWRLDGAPQPTDTAAAGLADVAEDLLVRWAIARESALPAQSDAFRLPAAPALCRGNPFIPAAPAAPPPPRSTAVSAVREVRAADDLASLLARSAFRAAPGVRLESAWAR